MREPDRAVDEQARAVGAAVAQDVAHPRQARRVNVSRPGHSATIPAMPHMAG